ncbi:MAG: tetratricopeptide repeat protein, partial [Nitrospirae bacterium]
ECERSALVRLVVTPVPWMISYVAGTVVIVLLAGLGGCSFWETKRANEQSLRLAYAQKKPGWAESSPVETQPVSEIQELSAQEAIARGDQLREAGNLAMALTYYRHALRQDPSRLDVSYRIGRLFLLKRLPQEALSQFQRLLDKDPNAALAYEGMGEALQALDRFPEAENALRRALALNPKLWHAHALLGILYAQQGRHNEAIREQQAAIRLNPHNPELYNNLGVSYLLAGRDAEAITMFQEAIRKGATHNRIYNNFGVVLTRVGGYHQALEMFRHGSNEASAYNNLGVLLLHAGHAQAAIPCFERAIELRPSFYVKAHESLRRARAMLREQLQNHGRERSPLSSPCPMP